MKESFVERRFGQSSLDLIEKANEILAEYAAQDYTLTLRQLYYQFVSRDIIPNNLRSYKNLGSVLNDARLAGLVDWDMIEDRGRELVTPSHWDGPADILDSAAQSFRMDKWEGQPTRVLVMAEKDAVSGILEPECKKLDVQFMANRGYCSQSAMYHTSKMMSRGEASWVVLYFGDHDPSGIDMTRDVLDRFTMFWSRHGRAPEVVRVALNMDQVTEYDPPPNPAKLTDSRAKGYIEQFGEESWELDAIEPKELARLLKKHVAEYRDDDLYDEMAEKEKAHRDYLRDLVNEAKSR